MSIRHDFLKPPVYFACVRLREGRPCRKKVSRMDGGGAGEFWCETCNSATDAQPRYILNFSISDHSGAVYVNCFDDVGEKIVGKPASELVSLVEGVLLLLFRGCKSFFVLSYLWINFKSIFRLNVNCIFSLYFNSL